jgi:hypothetical protein
MTHTSALLVSSINRRQTSSIDTVAFRSKSRVNSATVSATTSHGLAGKGVVCIWPLPCLGRTDVVDCSGCRMAGELRQAFDRFRS